VLNGERGEGESGRRLELVGAEIRPRSGRAFAERRDQPAEVAVGLGCAGLHAEVRQQHGQVVEIDDAVAVQVAEAAVGRVGVIDDPRVSGKVDGDRFGRFAVVVEVELVGRRDVGGAGCQGWIRAPSASEG